VRKKESERARAQIGAGISKRIERVRMRAQRPNPTKPSRTSKETGVKSKESQVSDMTRDE